MLVALERFDLRIPGCRSLKQKRHVLTTLTAALRQRFPVSVAEVDHHHLRRVMHEVEKLVERWDGTEVLDSELQLVWPED